MDEEDQVDPKMLDNLDMLINMEVLEAEKEWEILISSEESEGRDE